MSIKEGILKNSRYILIIITAIFFVIGLYFTISQQERIVSDLEEDMIVTNETISTEINNFFSKYNLLVKQLNNDEEMLRYVREVKDNSQRQGHKDYSSIITQMQLIKSLDNNIRNVWLAPNALNNYITQDPSFNIIDTLDDYTMTEGIWYESMFKTQAPIVVSPFYTSRYDGVYICSVYEPVLIDEAKGRTRDNIVGTIGLDIELTSVRSFIQEYQLIDGGFSIVINNEGNYLITPENWTGSTNILTESAELASLGNKMTQGSSDYDKITVMGQGYYVAYSPLKVDGWFVASFVPVEEVESDLNQFYFIGGLFLWTGIGLLAFTFITSKVNVHINKLQAANIETTKAYEQLSASEEELRAQYDEIESYVGQLEIKENYIRSLAYLDPLTGIPNRRQLSEDLARAIKAGHKGAVMLLDLDNFKEVNDTLGHVLGDKLLCQVANALSELDKYNIQLSRFGGDEFLLLLDQNDDEKHVKSIAEKIIHLFDHPFNVDGDDLFIGLSMGISLYPSDTTNIDELIMFADTAMYDVKAKGKNNYAFFDMEMAKDIHEKIRIENILRTAIENNTFSLVYQPQVNVKTGKVIGMEALLRLQDNSLSPGQFIPVAEETGRIIEIGRRVVEEAIRQQSSWLKAGYQIQPLAVNFSVTQLNDDDFINHIEHCLSKYNVPVQAIHLEITESIFIDNIDRTLKFLNQLKDLGIKIALDDFGSGYSSINYLTYMPIDILKLDKSLCDKLHEDGDVGIIESVIDIAHKLNIEALAEGVEHQSQLKLLKKVGCDSIQGYYFSKPLAKHEYEEKFLKTDEN